MLQLYHLYLSGICTGKKRGIENMSETEVQKEKIRYPICKSLGTALSH